MGFKGLIPPSAIRQSSDKKGAGLIMLRDNFGLTTWLCIGATIQSIAFLAAGRLALIPAISVLIYRIAIAYAMKTGLMPNPHMDGVLAEKYSAQFPDSQGHYGSKASNNDVAVLIIGTKTNHPLGILAPGLKDVGAYFRSMTAELEAYPEPWGFLGSSHYLGAARETNNDIMTIMYFRSADDVHRYAQSPLHREAWNWWNKTVAVHRHIAIYHELYHAPKGCWESVYMGMAPAGLAATRFRMMGKDESGGEVESWASPVVDATRGVLRSSAGRMAREVAKVGDEEKDGGY